MTIRILIVEDEEMIARRLERLVRRVLSEQTIQLSVVQNLEAAQTQVEEHLLDLVFLDLNLEGADGFDLLEEAAAGAFQTIIVSAYTDQAIKAFEYGVIDFVPKPFSEERLRTAVERYLGIAARQAARTTKMLAVREGGCIIPVNVADIHYISGASGYSNLHLRNGHEKLHDKSLDQLHAILAPDFERIHKSYLVRFSEIESLQAFEGSRYQVRLKGGSAPIELPVGRTRYRELRSRLEGVS